MASQKKQDIILILGVLNTKVIQAVEALEKKFERPFSIILVTHRKNLKKTPLNPKVLMVIDREMATRGKVEAKLLPYHSRIAAIVCRNENMMPLYGRLVTFFPYLKNPLPHSIQIANDKIQMRKVLAKYAPHTTPRFVIVKDAKSKTVAAAVSAVGFPCVVKPAALIQSQLVSTAYYPEELQKILKQTFKKINSLYRRQKVEQSPKVLVEQLIEGSLYSVDVHINSRGKLYFTPYIEIKTGKDIGRDDFFMYSQLTPSNLDQADLEKADGVVEDAIHAFGLRSCTAHVELYKTSRGFKIVEIGCRVGGYRDELLMDAFGINHNLNDVLIRLGKKPMLKKNKKLYTVFLKFWPTKNGTLKSIKGFKIASKFPFVLRAKKNYQIGDRVGFSKFGHYSICTFNLVGATRAQLLGNIRKVEKTLQIQVQ